MYRSFMLLTAAVVCGLGVVACAQGDAPLTIRMDADKKNKQEAFPDRILKLQDGILLVFSTLGRLQPSMGHVNIGYTSTLATYDPNTLAPKTVKEVSPPAAFGKSAMEDIFLLQGKPQALVSFQDPVAKKFSLNVCDIDPATLEIGPARELFTVNDVEHFPDDSRDRSGVMGLKVKPMDDGGFSIFCEPVVVIHPQVTITVRPTFVCAALDKDLKVLWSGRPTEDLGIAWYSFAVIPIGNRGMIITGPAERDKKDETAADVKAYFYDGKTATALEGKGVGPEVGPHDLQATLRPDGKITVAGVYGKIRSSFTMSARRTDGFYVGVIDPAARTWTAFTTVPVLNEKGKALYDLSAMRLESLSDNSARLLAWSGPPDGTLQDLYMLGIKSDGAVSFNTKVDYASGLNVTLYKAYDPALIVHGDRCYVVLNDLPGNGSRRAEGKKADNAALKGVPCVMEVMADGTTRSSFPTASSDPEQMVRPGRMHRIDDKTWATGAGLGAGYSYFGLGLITVK